MHQQHHHQVQGYLGFNYLPNRFAYDSGITPVTVTILTAGGEGISKMMGQLGVMVTTRRLEFGPFFGIYVKV